MRRALAALLLVLAGLGSAQVWYYNVDQDNRFDPPTLTFRPSALELMCAGLLEPGGTPAGGATVSNITLPAGCPAAPPVVVYGTDPDTGDPVYATVLTVKFWGRRRANDRTYGTDALVRVIKRSYALQVDASGDLGRVDDQFLPPFATPPAAVPPLTGAWTGWQASQTISFADPQISNVQNFNRRNRTCRDLYNDRCWTAVFTWVLPVRLVLHGNESGRAQLTLVPGLFVRRTATTLGVRGGAFEEPELKPYAP